MARNKPHARKMRLARAWKKSNPVPLWVVIRTLGKFRFHPHIRNWRRSKLKV